jgi:flavin reductase (DIM6/NTAB) family NADH-FMN oxidoreductase RutF
MLNQEHDENIISELLTPRLTVIVTTLNEEGVTNASPYSFFSAVSYEPPMVQLSIGEHKHFKAEHDSVHNERIGDVDEILKGEAFEAEDQQTRKDTLQNITDHGEFGVSVLPTEYLRELIITSVRWPNKKSELDKAGLSTYDSATIAPPLIEEAYVGVEVEAVDIQALGDVDGGFNMVLGEVTNFHVDTDVLEDDDISPEKIDPILEFSGGTFMKCTDILQETRYAYPDVFPDGYLDE